MALYLRRHRAPCGFRPVFAARVLLQQQHGSHQLPAAFLGTHPQWAVATVVSSLKVKCKRESRLARYQPRRMGWQDEA
jgi:hypothetical protein